MSLLDTVEPNCWVYNFYDPDPQCDIEFCAERPRGWPAHLSESYYSRETVESLLSQCRKEARKEALLDAADIADNGVVQGNHGNDVMTRHNIGAELRRMAESTMEGEEG